MILKNPYGFLIKHFKGIHLILTLIYIYLAFKVSSILQYYNNFINNSASKLDAMSYVDNYYIIAVVFSILICLIVYFLMRYKDKPRLLYLLLIALYIIVPVLIYISYGGLNVISFSVLESKTLRLYRDLLRIVILFQYVSIFVVLIRGLGFDIKKFNFVGDLENLELNEKDEEEIEVALGGTESIQRKFYRKVRELKYYYLENKVFIFIALFIVIVFFLGSVYFNKEVVNKVYQEGEVFSTEEFRFQVLNTFVTVRDLDNNIITNTDTSFVVVRMRLGSNRDAKEFNTSNLVLKANNNYSSNSKYGSRFLDLGNAYKGTKISGWKDYLFIYNVKNDDIYNDMKLEYAMDKVIKLNPIYLDEKKNSIDAKVGESVDLAKTIFGKGYFNISSYKIQDKFSYSYQYEVMGKSNTASLTISGNEGNILNMIVDYQLPFQSSLYEFFDKYALLKYKIQNEEYSSKLFSNKTPTSYKDGVYILVDKNLEVADSIWLEINMRNYLIKYILK